QCCVRFLRIGRRDERSRLELRRTREAAYEPDGELARDAELMQCLSVIALRLVHCIIAGAAEGMEERALLCPDDAAIGEASDQIDLCVIRRIETDVRCSTLCEELTELAELEERHDRIGREVLLGLHRERVEPHVVQCEEGEVRRSGRPTTWVIVPNWTWFLER